MLTTISLQNDPSYINEVIFYNKSSKWSFFWNIVAASVAYDLPLDGVVYMVSIDSRANDWVKKTIKGFYQEYKHYLEAPYENIVQVFFYHFTPTNETNPKGFSVISINKYMVIPAKDYTLEPFVNDNGVRLPNTILLGNTIF